MAMSPQDAAAAGLGWVPENNPNYGKPGFVGSTPASGGSATTPSATSSTTTDYAGPASGSAPAGSSTPPPASGSAPPPASGGSSGGYPAGWQADPSMGPGWAFNPSTGQHIPTNSPSYPGYGGATGTPGQGTPTGGGTPPPAGGGSPSEPGGGTGTGNATTEGGTGSTPPSTGANDVMDKHIRDLLVGMMGEDPSKVDVNSPEIQAQLAPFSAAAQRASDQQVSEGAEGAFANQQDFGAPEKEAARERMAAQIGQEGAGLVGTEQAARRADRTNAAGQAASLINTDIANRLKQEGITQTGDLATRELNIREELGKLGISAEQIDALMRDQEFMASLGLQAGTTAADLNNKAATSIMNG